MLSYTQWITFSVLTSCVSDTNTNNNNDSNENIAMNEIKTEELRLTSKFVSMNNMNDDDGKNNVHHCNHTSNSVESSKCISKETEGAAV